MKQNHSTIKTIVTADIKGMKRAGIRFKIAAFLINMGCKIAEVKVNLNVEYVDDKKRPR